MALNLQEDLQTRHGVHCGHKWDTLLHSHCNTWRLAMKTAGSHITKVRKDI